MIADAIYAFPSLLLAIVAGDRHQRRPVEPVGRASWRRRSRSPSSSSRSTSASIRAEIVRVKAEPFVESAKVIGASTSASCSATSAQRHAHPAADLHAQCLRGDPDARRPGLPRASASSRRRPPSGATTSTSRSATSRPASGGPASPGPRDRARVLGMTLVGESLNDLADPRLRARRRAGKGDPADAVAASSRSRARTGRGA